MKLWFQEAGLVKGNILGSTNWPFHSGFLDKLHKSIVAILGTKVRNYHYIEFTYKLLLIDLPNDAHEAKSYLESCS